MGLELFAHNGVHHANHVEATSHEAGTTLWLILATLLIIAAAFGVVNLLTRASRRSALQEDDEEGDA